MGRRDSSDLIHWGLVLIFLLFGLPTMTNLFFNDYHPHGCLETEQQEFEEMPYGTDLEVFECKEKIKQVEVGPFYNRTVQNVTIYDCIVCIDD